MEVPCRDIGHAFQKSKPGDIVFVEDGIYQPFKIENKNGTNAEKITLFAKGRQARVRGVGRCSMKDKTCRDAIRVVKSSYLVFDGIRAEGASRAGIAVELSPHITIKNGVFGPNGRWGIFTGFTDHIVIEQNETFGSVFEHGIYVSNSSDNPIIRNNLVHRNGGCGIQINADFTVKDTHGHYGGKVDGLTTDATISGNVIYENGVYGGAAINLDGVQHSVVHDNIIFDNLSRGIVFYGARI